MSDILKLLLDTLKNGGLASSLLAATAAFVFVFREFARFKLQLRVIDKGTREPSEQEEGEVAPEPDARGDNESLQDPKQVVNSNFLLLERYYSQTLNESRLNSRATIVIAALGFLVILIGVALVFSGTTAAGTVSTVAGLIAEASTVLFFKNNKEQLARVAEYHKKLVSTQYLLTAISLAGELESQERQNETKRIIVNLLFLSNELHGSSSDHLFAVQLPKSTVETKSHVLSPTLRSGEDS